MSTEKYKKILMIVPVLVLILSFYFGLDQDILKKYKIEIDTVAWASDLRKVDKEQTETKIIVLKDAIKRLRKQAYDIQADIDALHDENKPVPDYLRDKKDELDESILKMKNNLQSQIKRFEEM